MLDRFPIIGGGPAGAAVALAIARAGGQPVVYEKSILPRHKVCGEFLSPEILPVLDGLGVAAGFLGLKPVRLTHAELHFGRSGRRFRLPEPAYGLSRYALDHFLLREAVARGAEVRRERYTSRNSTVVYTGGRSAGSRRGRRLFGFKAHFAGAPNDAVELYFFRGGYCGLAPVEDGSTNVCGLAPEELLRAHEFHVDELLDKVPRLKTRLASLSRSTRWFTTGPLSFGITAPERPVLAAGDAACFVDPFTGSGLLGAVQTGAWAGATVLRAAEGAEWEECCAWQRRRCAAFYRRQLTTTTVIRRALQLGWAEALAGVVPGWLLFRLTRPSRLQ